MPAHEPVAVGRWGRVEWALDARGRLPAHEYFSDLSPGDQAKVLALFRRLADHGRVASEEKFKKVEEIFEFKSHQIRFLGDFRPGRRFVVAHGLRKKKNKLDRVDIEAAERILRENDDKERSGR